MAGRIEHGCDLIGYNRGNCHRLFHNPADCMAHVTAETLDPVQSSPRVGACTAGDPISNDTTHASHLDHAPHVTAVTSSTDRENFSHLDDGPHVSAETSRRIACDASILRLIENENGEPLSIGRKSRVIPPAMRRALRARDDGCRFPGCTNHSFIDGHHIEHWANGGETSLNNLVQLCRHRHRLVHEGGFHCEKDVLGNLLFRNPQRHILGHYTLPTPLPDDATIEDWMVSQMEDVEIDESTCIPNWMAGEKMDWDLAVAALF